jgi:hypothetical protein
MHAESFFIYAPSSLTDQSVRGRISVFFKQLLLAEIALDLRVAKDSTPNEEGWAKGTDQRFRKVFPSYSSNDVEVVEAMEQFQTTGSEYLRNVLKMRGGQQWSEGLTATIADADVFQLFWSRNAAPGICPAGLLGNPNAGGARTTAATPVLFLARHSSDDRPRGRGSGSRPVRRSAKLRQ